MIEAYITNLGRYNEGWLNGEYLKLPAKTEDVQALLKRIHVDGVRYEEVFITDYKTAISGLRNCLGENESIDELNYLASLLEDMDGGELEKFTAAVEYGEYTSTVKDLINLAQNLDYYEFIPGIENEEDYGRYCIEECSLLNLPESVKPYFDYEAYGRDISDEEGGCFLGGYIAQGWDNNFIEHYSGRDDIPDEYRIFAYPEITSIRDTLEQYKQLSETTPVIPNYRPKSVER